MSVDVGLGIVVTKRRKMYGIQVKTSNLNSYKTYIFDIRKASFERHDSGNIYYIFVLHGDKSDNFLILSFHKVEKLVEEKVILDVGHGKRYGSVKLIVSYFPEIFKIRYWISHPIPIFKILDYYKYII